MRNQRLRRGMAQKQLAKSLRVHPFTVVRYERNSTTPDSNVQQRLKGVLGEGFERFLKRATISTGASGQPTSAVSRSESSGRHEAKKKQAVTSIQIRSRRSGVLGHALGCRLPRPTQDRKERPVPAKPQAQLFKMK
jgi:transcriptional regulator with XRE-family HTH domain